MAHITGGGFLDNIPRVLPKTVKAVIEKGAWPIPPIFELIRKGGGIEEEEMFRTFNCGIGLVLVVRKKDAEGTIKTLKDFGESPYLIGRIASRGRREKDVELTGPPLGEN